MHDTLIYLAITRGKNRLVVSGSFELYQDLIRTSQPTIYNPAEPFLTETFTIEKGDQHDDQKPE